MSIVFPDTLLEWSESAVAVLIMIISFGLGSFFAVKILKFLAPLAFLGLLYFAVYQSAQGLWTSWQDLASTALSLGLLSSFLLAPLTTITDFEARIDKLELEANKASKKDAN